MYNKKQRMFYINSDLRIGTQHRHNWIYYLHDNTQSVATWYMCLVLGIPVDTMRDKRDDLRLNCAVNNVWIIDKR